MSNPTVVLVHGAWSGAWTWSKVCKLLDERGIAHRAVDLPTSRAEDTSINVLDDVRHVESVIDEIGGPVVLIGNSYGGVVLTGVDRPSVQRLVYLAAQMPAAGEPILGLLSECACPVFQEGVTMLDDGRLSIDTEVVVSEAYCQASSDDHDEVRAKLAPAMSFGTDFAVAYDTVAWQRYPTTYVVCADDRATQPEWERKWAQQVDDAREWPTDHCPQASHPHLVADLLAELIRS